MPIEYDIAKASIELVGEFLGNRLRAAKKTPRQDTEKITQGIQRHLFEVTTWADQLQFLGMGTPQSVDEATVALNLNTEPRRFRTIGADEELKSESDLLILQNHCLLLGEPGSGKTTTLKRLARYMLVEPPLGERDTCQYPLVVRLRELSLGESIFTKLASIFRLRYDQVEVITRIEAEDKRAKTMGRTIKNYETRIGDKPIEDVIANVLDATEAFILLDGLDEVPPEHRNALREEFVILGRKLRSARVLTSCRSGDYVAQMAGYRVMEICPLSADQIEAIKVRWLGSAEDDFLEQLRAVPYYDLADRPLLLTQLLFLYKRYGYLPEQPAMIYKKIVRLLLEEWDVERGIVRKSKYATFDPERKAAFLAALSFHVTYVLSEKSFTEGDLMKAYIAIRAPFNLPVNEARQVAREIQTHTGIIVAGPRDTYEFCHLSLQEYLCANCLVRDPFVTGFGKNLVSYVAPLAVAVTLSSKPGSWLGKLMLKDENFRSFDEAALVSFMSRLVLERPFFEVSEPLAFALFRLFHAFKESKNVDVRSKLEDLVEMAGAVESVAAGLRWYTLYEREGNSDLTELRLNIGSENPYSVPAPRVGALPSRILPRVLKLSADPLSWMTSAGKRILNMPTARRLAKKGAKW